jgi:NADPH-dependent 2,4-dienoyl-CoA reductase/sulfur reductase-like enzyme
VIGGGPAGLTAACEAARLGHRVELFEKEKACGGQLRFAGKPPFKAVYGEWGVWLSAQARKMGVRMHLGREVNEGTIREGKPDAVILATGGEKVIPNIPGTHLPHVSDAWKILSGETPPGKQALVIGGGLIGMETADFLAAKGTRVVLAEALKRSPVLKITSHGYMLHTRLRDAGCRLLFSTTVKQIGPSSVTLVSEGGEEVIAPIDQVVIAVGLQPREGLRKALEEIGVRHFVVGDASSPRRIIEATEEGAAAAWKI